jgi:non-heme chloroperoxidase
LVEQVGRPRGPSEPEARRRHGSRRGAVGFVVSKTVGSTGRESSRVVHRPTNSDGRAQLVQRRESVKKKGMRMAEFTTNDGTQIFYKDWGVGQPIVFSHGWPLSADDWDTQMLFFLHRGYRVIAHDRRGHGRSAQVSEGNDMDHYADDLADLTQHLDLHDAVHVGHSAGGGEVARYIGRHGESRVAKVVLISAVTPSVLQTDTNPAGVPQAAFEGLQAQLAANRAEFYRAVPSGPFYNFDQPGVEPIEAVIANWWRQGMMGSAKGQYDCVSEFIREDYT